MAEKIPTMENVTPIQPGPVVSAAPQFAAAQKVVGNLEDMVNKNLQRKADSNALAEGGLAGEDIGFVPLKGGGRATQIYNEAALSANKFTLSADIGTKAAKLGNELGQDLKGNQTLDEFRARFQGYADGVLSKTPARNHAYAKNLLQAHANAQLKTLQTKITKQNNELAFVHFNRTFETNKDIMENASRHGLGPLAMGHYAIAERQINAGLKAGWLTAGQASIGHVALKQGLYTNRLLFNYETAQKANQMIGAQGKGSDEFKILSILNQNADKNFVKRILNPRGQPILDLGKGKFATHKMAWTTVDGKTIVYPKVIQDSQTKELKELSSKDAVKHALDTNEFISTDNPKQAEWLSTNYKKLWNIKDRVITFKKPETATDKVRDALKNGYNDIFSVHEKDMLSRQFDAMDKQQATRSGINEQEYKTKVDTALFQKAHGVKPSTNLLLDIQTLKPKQYADFQKKLVFRGIQSQIVSTTQSGNIGTIQAEIGELQKPLTPQEIASPDILEIQAMKKAAADRLITTQKLIKDDPITFIKSRPGYQKEIDQAIENAQAKTLPLDPQTPNLEQAMNEAKTKAIIGAQADVLLKHQKQIGITEENTRILDNPTRDTYVNNIRSLPTPDKQVQALKSITDLYKPDQQGTVLKDLQGKDKLPSGTQYLLRVHNSDDFKQYAPSVNVALSHKIDDYSDTLQTHALTKSTLEQLINNTDSAQKYGDALASMGGDTTNAYQDFVKNSMLVAAQLMHEGGQGASPSDAIDKATNILLAGVQFGTDKGATYQYPAKLNANHLSNAMEMVRDEALNTDIHLPDSMRMVFPSTFLESQNRSLLIATGHFATTHDQRAVQLVDQHKSPILTKDGKPFRIPFKELMNSNSDLSQQVYKYRVQREARFIEKLPLPKTAQEALERYWQKVVSDNLEAEPLIEKFIERGRIKPTTTGRLLFPGLVKKVEEQ